jgi:hypothetical protein
VGGTCAIWPKCRSPDNECISSVICPRVHVGAGRAGEEKCRPQAVVVFSKGRNCKPDVVRGACRAYLIGLCGKCSQRREHTFAEASGSWQSETALLRGGVSSCTVTRRGSTRPTARGRGSHRMCAFPRASQPSRTISSQGLTRCDSGCVGISHERHAACSCRTSGRTCLRPSAGSSPQLLRPSPSRSAFSVPRRRPCPFRRRPSPQRRQGARDLRGQS